MTQYSGQPGSHSLQWGMQRGGVSSGRDPRQRRLFQPTRLAWSQRALISSSAPTSHPRPSVSGLLPQHERDELLMALSETAREPQTEEERRNNDWEAYNRRM